jgi:hypothetical protein
VLQINHQMVIFYPTSHGIHGTPTRSASLLKTTKKTNSLISIGFSLNIEYCLYLFFWNSRAIHATNTKISRVSIVFIIPLKVKWYVFSYHMRDRQEDYYVFSSFFAQSLLAREPLWVLHECFNKKKWCKQTFTSIKMTI